MNHPERFRRALIWFSWVPFAVAGAMAMYQQESSREVYVSTAKLVADPMSLAFRPGMTGPGREERMAEFRATQVEPLNSAQVEASTLERLRLSGKQKPSAEATLEIRPQGEAPAVIELRCSSNDPDYASDYLKERIAEYLNFRKKVIDSNVGELMGKVIQEVLQKQKDVQMLTRSLEQMEKGDPASLREMEELRLAKLVSQLRGEVEQITMAPGADASEQNVAHAKAVKTRQAAAEQELQQVADRNAAIRKTKSELDKAIESHAAWKKRLSELDEIGITIPPSVSILQAATAAVKVEPPVLIAAVKGAAGGAGIGLVMMLLMALVLGLFRRKEPMAGALPS
jgi:hypothetical protein